MSDNKTTDLQMSSLRSALFPIHNHELKKFLPTGMIMFFILFNYTVLRDVKDTLIQTAPGIGATEIIPYLKFGLVLPSAILFVVMYTKLANVLNQEKIFYTLVTPFLVYFGLFALVLYPNIESLHPSIEAVQALQAEYPRMKFIFPIWGLWTYSAFYVLSELWGSVMISLLFWQFANEITRTQEAKRFYAMFGLLANVALIFSGQTGRYFSAVRDSLPEGVDPWGYTLNYLMTFICLSGVIIMAIYRWMNVNVLTDKRFYDAADTSKKSKKKKPKLSVGESFKYLLSSPYLGLIAVLVICYGVSINLVELVWKEEVKRYYTTPNEFNEFRGMFSTMVGVFTMAMIMTCKGIVRKFGWYTGAVVTPIVIAITSAIFFGLVLFEDAVNPLITITGATAAYVAVMVGATQNVLSKGAKYSLFDPTKEMAYIPLDQELKMKGKAAVDVIGGRLGKASGGVIAIALFTIFSGGIAEITPYVAVIVGVISVVWILAAGALGRKYNALVDESEN